MNSEQTYHLTVSSERDSIRQVEPFMLTIPGLTAMSSARFHDLLVAVTEAVNNAIIHGNGSDASKTVMLDARLTPTEITVVITDQGPGFDPESIPDPRLPENLLREGGRGVFLIKHLADSVAFTITDAGTSVAITYSLV